jgi:two-component system chemotaxis sensor kinase CheA
LGQRLALAIDDILGARQVVMKSLEANYNPVEGIAAATILGDGGVALIIDVNALVRQRGAKRANERLVANG